MPTQELWRKMRGKLSRGIPGFKKCVCPKERSWLDYAETNKLAWASFPTIRFCIFSCSMFISLCFGYDVALVFFKRFHTCISTTHFIYTKWSHQHYGMFGNPKFHSMTSSHPAMMARVARSDMRLVSQTTWLFIFLLVDPIILLLQCCVPLLVSCSP